MKIGDLVRWKGFPGAKTYLLEKQIGVIVAVQSIGGCLRYDVLWGDGTVGYKLYPHCISVVKGEKGTT